MPGALQIKLKKKKKVTGEKAYALYLVWSWEHLVGVVTQALGSFHPPIFLPYFNTNAWFDSLRG